MRNHGRSGLVKKENGEVKDGRTVSTERDEKARFLYKLKVSKEGGFGGLRWV